MTMTNPSLELTFLGGDLPAGHSASQTITAGSIIRDSVSITYQLLNGLKSSSNQIQMSIASGCSSVEDIIATDGDIAAVFKDGSTVLFTGYVSTNFSWSVTDTGEQCLKIELEDVGTRLLGKSYLTSGHCLFNTTASSVIESVCLAAGITIASSCPLVTSAVTKIIDSSVTCKEILETMLYELGYVYYFTNLGELMLFKIDCTSTAGLTEYDKDDLCTNGNKAIALSKNIRQYRSVRVKFTELATVEDYLVYRNTTEQDDSHPYCYLPLEAGEYFDGLEVYTEQEWEEETVSEFREPSLVEVCNASSETDIVGSKSIIALTDIDSIDFVSSGGTISNSITAAGGPYLQILNHNSHEFETGHITQQDVYGSIIYEKSQGVVRTSDSAIVSSSGDSLFEEDVTYIHTKALVTRHANLVAQYNKYCNSKYTFYSKSDITLGEIVRITDNAFSGLSVAVLVYGKKKQDSTAVIQYSAVGISVFSLDEDAYSQKTGNGEQESAQGSDGEDASAVYLGVSSCNIRCNSSGYISGTQDITIPVFCRKGSSKIAGAISVGSLPSGCSVVSTVNPTASADGSVVMRFSNGYSPPANYGCIAITVSADSESWSLAFVWIKSRDGSAGSPGQDGKDAGKFLGVQNSQPSSPNVNDYYVTTSGLAYYYTGSGWNTLTDGDKLLTCLNALKNTSGIDLSAISNGNAVSWMSALIADRAIFSKLFAQELTVQGRGTFRGAIEHECFKIAGHTDGSSLSNFGSTASAHCSNLISAFNNLSYGKTYPCRVQLGSGTTENGYVTGVYNNGSYMFSITASSVYSFQQINGSSYSSIAGTTLYLYIAESSQVYMPNMPDYSASGIIENQLYKAGGILMIKEGQSGNNADVVVSYEKVTVSGNSVWRRKWKSGLYESGGTVTTSSAQYANVYFADTFDNTSYEAYASAGGGSGYTARTSIGDKSMSGFRIYTDRGSAYGTWYYYWSVRGYLVTQ